jgi:hypothetical protein
VYGRTYSPLEKNHRRLAAGEERKEEERMRKELERRPKGAAAGSGANREKQAERRWFSNSGA